MVYMFTHKVGGLGWAWTVQVKTNEKEMTYSFGGKFDNPWWRNYKIGMDSQITHFIYLLHLETLHSVVVLKKNQLGIQSNLRVQLHYAGSRFYKQLHAREQASYHTETQHYVNFSFG